MPRSTASLPGLDILLGRFAAAILVLGRTFSVNKIIHFTPTSASWRNAVEGFFATLTTRRLRRGTFLGVVDLQASINRYLAERNANPKPFRWQANPDTIIAAPHEGPKCWIPSNRFGQSCLFRQAM